MKAATYARFSTDMQRDASIDDQCRNCARFAEREGWKVVAAYDDRGMSGTRTDRPGYQRMLTDAKARAFDVLLVDDLSRLARDSVENETVLRRLEHWGIRVVGVSDGYDSASKGRKMQRGMRGIINEAYIDDLREKTHRGLTGQALKGSNCGGRSYGYKHIPIEDPTRQDQYGRAAVIAVKREKDPEQAKWIKSIFEWYADGYSPRWIAGELNRLGVPSPGSTWKRKERRTKGWLSSTIHGDPLKGTGFLSNPLYIGEYIWNRSRWVKDPDTGKKERRERPKDEWIITAAPALRIIPQDLWERVKARQKGVRAKSKAIQAALHENARTGAGPKYLFSGLLTCSECEANFVMISGYQYGCASHTNGGKHACGNGLRVSRALVEEKLLEGIKRDLFTTEAIALFKKETTRLLAEHKRAHQPDMAAKKRRLSQVEKELDGMVAAIKAGAFSDTLKAALGKTETERADLLAALSVDTRDLDKVVGFLPRAVDRYRELVEDLGTATQRDVARARAQIKTLLGGAVRLVPAQGRAYLEAEIAGDYAGLLKMAGNKISVVAGAGFEPATFGL